MQQHADEHDMGSKAESEAVLDETALDETALLTAQGEEGVRLVVMGVSGCGKSHIGQQLADRLEGASFIDGDDYHGDANVAKMAQGIPLTDEDRHGWLARLVELIKEARREKRSLVLACSSLKRRYRDQLRGGDEALGFVFLEGSRALLLERLEARTDHFFKGEAMLDDQLATLEVPGDGEQRIHAVNIDATPAHLVEEVCQRLIDEQARSGAARGLTTP